MRRERIPEAVAKIVDADPEEDVDKQEVAYDRHKGHLEGNGQEESKVQR